MCKRVLTVCRGNACRSPMMKSQLKKFYQNKPMNVKVKSAGIDPEIVEGDDPTDKSVIALGKLFRINIRKHKRRYAGNLDLDIYSVIYTVGAKEKQKLIELGAKPKNVIVMGGDEGVPNPYNQNQDFYDHTAETIQQWIEANQSDLILTILG